MWARSPPVRAPRTATCSRRRRLHTLPRPHGCVAPRLKQPHAHVAVWLAQAPMWAWKVANRHFFAPCLSTHSRVESYLHRIHAELTSFDVFIHRYGTTDKEIGLAMSSLSQGAIPHKLKLISLTLYISRALGVSSNSSLASHLLLTRTH